MIPESQKPETWSKNRNNLEKCLEKDISETATNWKKYLEKDISGMEKSRITELFFTNRISFRRSLTCSEKHRLLRCLL